MAPQLIRESGVARPNVTPLKSTILDHTGLTEYESFGLRNLEGLWPSYNCLDSLVPIPICPEPVGVGEEGYKTFTRVGWVPAFEFAVYGAVQCSNVGLDVNDQVSELKRVFTANQARGIEKALKETRFVATTSGDPVQWDAPIDLGVYTSVAQVLGVLEGYAASVYAGVPTLHMPRSVVLMAFGLGLLVEIDGKFYTYTGAKVAAGGGYDDPTSPLSMDIFITGEVVVEASGTVDVNTYVLPGDGSGVGSDDNGLADNTHVALVERMFRVGVDCLTAKASLVLDNGGSGSNR